MIYDDVRDAHTRRYCNTNYEGFDIEDSLKQSLKLHYIFLRHTAASLAFGWTIVFLSDNNKFQIHNYFLFPISRLDMPTNNHPSLLKWFVYKTSMFPISGASQADKASILTWNICGGAWHVHGGKLLPLGSVFSRMSHVLSTSVC